MAVNLQDRTLDSKSSSDYTINMPPDAIVNNIKSVKLLGVLFPRTFYNIITGVNDKIAWSRRHKLLMRVKRRQL